MKRALITGIKGQDGSYLSELLREKGYEVHGIERGDGDLADTSFVEGLVSKNFDEIYNFASVSSLEKPWEAPLSTVVSAGFAPIVFLDAIKRKAPETRFFQASSAEMYGNPVESPQNETTRFAPRGPYGWGKLLAHNAVESYRKSQGLFAVSGILFNHESPRRPHYFVTQKIVSTLARIAGGSNEVLELGNLDSVRDWSFAGDVVKGMWLSLMHATPETYVFASGKTHTVREFVNAAAQALGLTLRFEGSGLNERGKDDSGRVVVRVNPEFFRPMEANVWCGDIQKAKSLLNWEPSVSFEELVRLMVRAYQ